MQAKLLDYRLKLRHTFRISGAMDRDFVDIGIVRLEAGGVVTFGEASPSRFWGESMDDVRSAFAEIDWQKFQDLSAYEAVLAEIRQETQPPQALGAAIEMAVLDLVAQRQKKRVRDLLNLPDSEGPRSSFTIGIADLETIALKVLEAKPYPILKIKLGSAHDIEIIEQVRSLTDKPLRVDANEGWDKEEAVEKINWLQTQEIEFVEQPLPAADIDETAWIRERVDLPIMADESVKNSASVPAIAHAFDGINIKLMKCGGILEAVRMVEAARAHSMSVMVGCMTEGSLGIAAGAQILPLVDYADLDGSELIRNDPFLGLSMQDGYIKIAGATGLGVHPREGSIE